MKKWIAAIAVAASTIAAAPANGEVYIIDFTIGSANGGTGSATLTTAGDASTGFSLVTALMGDLDGDALTLLAPGTFPTNGGANDNLFRTSATPFFDANGLSFSAGGNNYNLYGNGVFYAACIGVSGTTTSCNGGAANSATVTLQTAAVPEPATWGLMLLGFGAIGFAARRSRRQRLAVVV